MAQVQKYFDTVGVGAYLITAFSALLVGYKYLLPKFVSRVTEKQALWLAGATFLVLLVVFAIAYPIANSGLVAGGSDRDDNLNVATTALLHGRYPYYFRGYLGSPTHSLPGSLVLAVPFVLIGNSAYQNFFWLAIFFIAMRLYLKDGRLALLMLWASLLLSPGLLHELVTGGDLISNSLYVLLFMLFMVNAVPRSDRSCWLKAGSAILLGVGLSSRANFLLLLPLVFSMLVQIAGWKAAAKYVGLTCMTFGAITIPFYLYDPQGFYPLHALGIITQFHSILPFAGRIVPLVGGITALALSFQHMDCGGLALLRNSAMVQAFPVFCVIVLSMVQARGLDFAYAGYGLNFLFFGALASWANLAGRGACSDG